MPRVSKFYVIAAPFEFRWCGDARNLRRAQALVVTHSSLCGVLIMAARHNSSRFGARLASIILAANLVGGLMTAAVAQAPPPSPAKPQIPEKVAPPLEDGLKQKKLEHDEGVIKPPGGVDPGMTAKPPDTDKGMPVIPPPGSPGGDKSVQPK